MTYATFRAAAEHIARAGTITPHQLAAWEAAWRSASDAQRREFTDLWRAQGSPAAAPPAPSEPGWLAPALKLIKEFEGCHLDAYICPAGIPTIGWGSTRLIDRPVKLGDRISQELADDLLRNDVEGRHRKLVKLLPLIAGWPGHRVAALVSWAYNVGVGAVESSTLRRRLLAGEDPVRVVSEELPRWDKANGKPLDGLTRRRAAEVALFVGQQLQQHTWMTGPAKRPDLKPGDHHLIANDVAETLTAWTHDGKRLWQISCLCRGQGHEAEWTTKGSDTPPGLYLVGKVYRDYEQDPSATFSADRRAYGWYSFDLLGQEGQEGPRSRYNRDGIMIHGGGTACGWPGAWAPRQALHPTLGCIRLHNIDLRDRILPLVGMGRIWVSVYQEAA